MKTLMVIDGNSMMFRAYYGTAYGSLMQTSTGIYTNAVFTFINMIAKVKATYEPDYLYIAFDKGKKTIRHQEYADYKAGRAKLPDELRSQIPLCKEYLDIMNIPHLELDDYEADDIVGTIAVKYHQEFDRVIIISGDKDLLQLVNDNIIVGLYRQGGEIKEYNKDNFYEIMGFHPHQLIDYKGIAGDSSDNLPGIKGIGDKGAINLLNTYGSLENVIAHADELSRAQQKAVLTNYEEGLKCKHLATIITDAKFPFALEDAIIKTPNYEKLREFYTTLEFKSLLKGLDDIHETKKSLDVAIAKSIDVVIEEIKKNQKLYLEVELTNLNVHKGDLIGIVISSGHYSYYLDKDQAYLIKDILNDRSIAKYCLDAKKTIIALHKVDLELSNIVFDLRVACYIINPRFGDESYNIIFNHFLDQTLPLETDIYGNKAIIKLDNIENIINYAYQKVTLLTLAAPVMLKNIQEIDCDYLFNEIEMPLCKTLSIMEENGFKINPDRINELGDIFLAESQKIEQEIYKLANHEFNINSPKQLGIVIFEELKLDTGKKNKTGYVTNAQVLEKLALKYELPKLVLLYRKYAKLISTYVNGLLEEIDNNNFVHTSFKQTLTLTGRLSSVEPNIQNIPVRTSEGKLIRSAFISRYTDGYLVSADYSQIEIRVLAHLSNTPKMIEQINEGRDFHTATASSVFGVPMNEVTKDMRRIAKAVNFGIVYGLSPYGLSEDIGISVPEAYNFIDKYFKTYPEVKSFMDNTVSKATKDGYTTTLFNRRRYIPELHEGNAIIRDLGKRTAMNAPVQGSAADIMKIAMNKVQKQIETNNLKAKMVAQVHDEIIIDCPKDELDIVKTILSEQLENAVKLSVKLDVDVEYGTTWDIK